MLFFGYLGEIGVIDVKLSTILGFIFLGITFYIIVVLAKPYTLFGLCYDFNYIIFLLHIIYFIA
jgi:hypothetical protein